MPKTPKLQTATQFALIFYQETPILHKKTGPPVSGTGNH
jgi:hypothetical protein